MEESSKQLPVYALILAGGVGSRLWPKSRQKTPKHLLSLYTDNTMLQETVKRVEGFVKPENVFVVTHASHRDAVVAQLKTLNPKHIIGEPYIKNTAWAMGLGAAFIAKENPDAIIINLAADHVVKNLEAFKTTMLAACKAASSGDYLLTVGIVPQFAHTGLGYIRIGDKKETIDGLPVYHVRGFSEKPDEAKAAAFIATKEYFWNANLYTWKATSFLHAISKYLPDVSSELNRISSVIGTSEEEETIKDVYEGAEDLQVDKAVSEKADNLLMVPGDFGWSDIGDWSVLHEVKSNSKEENVVIGDLSSFIGLDTKGTLIHTDKRLIATVGLEDMVIIDTPDALLIAPKSKVQDVKKIVEQLKKDKMKDFL